MIEFDPADLQGQNALKNLSALIHKGTIPHALLFTGIEGTGKRTAAAWFAMACNCKEPSASGHENLLTDAALCNCRSCNKIRTGNHPDIHWIEPSGTFIKIDQIRELCSELSIKPYEAKIRAAVISGAQAMTIEAANSLLKMLEEPPDRTVLILTALQKSDLLPTIVSRCQPVRFTPVSRNILEARMIEKYGVSKEDAVILSALADGSMAKLNKGSSAQKKQIQMRNWLLHMGSLIADPAEQPSSGILLAFAEKLSKDKKNLPDYLDIIRSWFRDLIVFQYDPEKIIHKDLYRNIRDISRKTRVNLLLSKIETVQAAQRDIRTNANARLTLEVMMLRLAKK